MKTIIMKNKSTGKWEKGLLILALGSLLQGCFLFGAGNDTSDPPDVCEGKFNAVVRQDKDGIGVTRARCEDSPRGMWLQDGGGCYCHGRE